MCDWLPYCQTLTKDDHHLPKSYLSSWFGGDGGDWSRCFTLALEGVPVLFQGGKLALVSLQTTTTVLRQTFETGRYIFSLMVGP